MTPFPDDRFIAAQILISLFLFIHIYFDHPSNMSHVRIHSMRWWSSKKFQAARNVIIMKKNYSLFDRTHMYTI